MLSFNSVSGADVNHLNNLRANQALHTVLSGYAQKRQTVDGTDEQDRINCLEIVLAMGEFLYYSNI